MVSASCSYRVKVTNVPLRFGLKALNAVPGRKEETSKHPETIHVGTLCNEVSHTLQETLQTLRAGG